MISYIKSAFEKKVIPYIESGLEWVITPGQYGFDLWATEVIIKLRNESYPDLKVSMITAFMNQEENWKESRRHYYESIKSQVDFYTEVSKQPYAGPWQFQARDQILFYKTDGIMLFYDEEAAPSSMKYVKQRAMKKQEKEPYEIITIVADDIQNSIEQDQFIYEDVIEDIILEDY